jgi:hypothetical protein
MGVVCPRCQLPTVNCMLDHFTGLNWNASVYSSVRGA